MKTISRAYSRKHTRKFDKLRDLVYVCWRTFKLFTASRLICSTSPWPVSSWWPIPTRH